jgi:hypothetical protein
MSRTNVGRFTPPEDCYAHAHIGRSVCRICTEAWLPHRQIARLNEAEAMSIADYIDSQS